MSESGSDKSNNSSVYSDHSDSGSYSEYSGESEKSDHGTRMKKEKLPHEQEQWKDVKPIPDKQNAKLPFYVQHSALYDSTMGLLRAVLNSGERSERVLTLANKIIRKNFTDNTAWMLKRECLEELTYDPIDQIIDNQRCLNKYPKPYQIWQQRKWIVDNAERNVDQVCDIADILYQDSRNFHAWSYIHWISDRWNMHKEFFNLTTEFLELDCCNGSAWACRATLFPKSGKNPEDELNFAFKLFSKDCTNEGACSYILMLCDFQPKILAGAIEKATNFNSKHKKAKFSYSLLIHLHQKNKSKNSIISSLCDQISKIDPPRAKYWKLVASGKL